MKDTWPFLFFVIVVYVCVVGIGLWEVAVGTDATRKPLVARLFTLLVVFSWPVSLPIWGLWTGVRHVALAFWAILRGAKS